MTSDFSAAMRRALQLTRAANVMEATRVIQRALGGRASADASPAEEPRAKALRLLRPPRPASADAIVEPPPQPSRTAAAPEASVERRPSGRERRPLGEVLKLLRRADRPASGLAPARRAGIAEVSDGPCA